MKVRLIVTVDIDPEKWRFEYGDKPANEDVWRYFYDVLENAVYSSGAHSTVNNNGVVIR